MDLSINKIKKTQQNNINFKGVSGGYDIDNVPVVRFNPPPYNPNTQKVSLEFAFLEKDDKTYSLIPPEKNSILTQEFEGVEPLIIPCDECLKYGKAIAYRYKIETKEGEKITTDYLLDPFEKIKLKNSGGEMNVLEAGRTYEISPKSGAMYHAFLDSNAILTSKEKGKFALADTNTEFVRNHFNKLNGSLNGLYYLLTEQTQYKHEFDPYTYIISNPTIGVDKISSSGYWPENLYQCEDEEVFKNFNFELFKRGKGYVADGAFTSQSLQSPLVQHVLKWGEESPWYNMLKVDGKPAIGIYPRKRESDDNPYEHIGVRIANNPNDKKNYDASKPTYLQFYDDRMSSKKQREDTTKLIETYDSSPENHYEISTYDDSVYPFYFKLDLHDVNTRKKLNEFKNQNAVLLKDLKQGAENFLMFDNFSIVSRDDSSGAVFWDGNRDLIKFNLSNPNNYNAAKIQGMKDARQYLCGIPAYWTEMVQSDLILRTAQMSDLDKKKAAKNNRISEESYNDIINEEITGEALHPVLEENKSVKDCVEEFPLQSIKTMDELSAVFAQPQFKKVFLSDGTEDKIVSIVNSIIDNAIPEKYKNNSEYKEYKEYKTYVVKTCANSIIKNVLINAMDKNAINNDGSINEKELQNVNLKTFGADNCTTAKEERTRVARKLAGGIDQKGVSSLEKNLKEELKDVTLEDFKLAESIIIQGKAGLNWRFDAAKDVVDLDAVRSESKDFKDLFWEGKYSFITLWEDFTSNIKKYNPSSYIITELTDAWDFFDEHNREIQERFDKHLRKPDNRERDLVLDTRATTTSNYAGYFNHLSIFAGVNPENHQDISQAGDIYALRSNIIKYLNGSQPNMGINSHSFFDNHDKPRVLHTLPLDMELFLADTKETYRDINTFDESKKKQIRSVLGDDFDFSEVSSKAMAVALIIDEQIEKMSYSQETQNKLKAALRQLAKGQKKEGGSISKRRSEAFGNQDYRISIKDMFERAGIQDKDIKEKIGKGKTKTVWDETLEFNRQMLSHAMQQLQSLWEVTNAIPGTPTLFNGTEFAQTGYEERCKNPTVKNREQIEHELQEDERYKAFYQKMQAITGLYKEPQLSALRGGTPTILKISGREVVDNMDAFNYFISQISQHGGKEKLYEFIENKDYESDEKIKDTFEISEDFNNWKNFAQYAREGKFKEYYEEILPHIDEIEKEKYFPIYSYDEKGSQTISVISKNGIYSGRANQSDEWVEPKEVSSIKIVNEDNICPLAEGTVLKKKTYDKGKYIDDGIQYVIKDKSIVRADKKPIIFDDTVVTFYVPKQEPQKYYWYKGAQLI